MISTVLMRILLAEYLVLAIVCAFEKRYALIGYWVGASILTASVLKGMK